MATIGGQDFTNFRAVNLRGSTNIRLQGNAAGTVSFDSSDGADRAWRFPSKSGVFPVMGTFSVQLPSGIAGADFSTVVTVSGITAEDALVVMPNKHNSAAYGFENSTGFILVAAEPRSGAVALFFQNLGNATGYTDRWYSYLAAR